jgi:hypothetical protein
LCERKGFLDIVEANVCEECLGGKKNKSPISGKPRDPYAPWQKGGIENAIGRLRRFIPRKTDLASLPDADFHALVGAYNSTPRKCLRLQDTSRDLLRTVALRM